MAETVNTNQFKNGMHIQLDGDVWRIVEFQHVKPGKGGAFVRTKLKALGSGAVVDRTFRAGEKFTRIRTETKDMQYLYDAGDEVVFMDQDTYEQTALPRGTHEDKLDRQRTEALVELPLQLVASPVALGLWEPIGRQLDAPVLTLEHVPDDERAVRLEEEHRLGPVDALDDDRFDTGRQLDRLSGTPEPSVVALEHGRGAALVPVHGEEYEDRPPESFDVAIERRPEPLFLRDRDERIDHGDGVGQLGIDRCHLGPPVLRVITLGVI